jgi:hypothetical protein
MKLNPYEKFFFKRPCLDESISEEQKEDLKYLFEIFPFLIDEKFQKEMKNFENNKNLEKKPRFKTENEEGGRNIFTI